MPKGPSLSDFPDWCGFGDPVTMSDSREPHLLDPTAASGPIGGLDETN